MSAKRLDAPLDYRQLWLNLRARIDELCIDQASKAAVEDGEISLRRQQGAYRFGYTIIAEMDRLQDEARKSYGPLRNARDDGALDSDG